MKRAIVFITLLCMISIAGKSQDFTPTETEAFLEWVITDPNKVPEESASITVESEDKSFIRSGVSDIDGKFILLAPEGKKYLIKVQKFGKHFHFDVEIPVYDGAAYVTQPLRISLIKSYVRSYSLSHVNFDINKWEIRQDAMATLNKLYESFRKNPKLIVEIAGHTDNIGDDANNMRLSQRRADAIRDYLIKKGISPERILAKGYGEKSPVASNETEAGRSRNRRTEVKVIEE